MRIGELAARSGVSVRALRYYEEQGLLSPRRSSARHRIYSADHQREVAQLRELFDAGFCSAVIRELLPAFSDAGEDDAALAAAFDAAEARLLSEKQSIEAELFALARLREQRGVAPDAHVRVEGRAHDSPTETAPFDHRDRRLR